MQINLAKELALHLIAVLFVVLNLPGIRVFGVSNLIPLFDIMMIYYFAIYKPEVFSSWFLFLLGLWSDALNGIPLGLTSLSYILIVKFFNLLNQRLIIRETFVQVLQQFISFIFLILLFKWAVLSVYHATFYNIINPLTQLVISSIFYVVMHKFFDFLSQKLLADKISA